MAIICLPSFTILFYKQSLCTKTGDHILIRSLNLLPLKTAFLPFPIFAESSAQDLLSTLIF